MGNFRLDFVTAWDSGTTKYSYAPENLNFSIANSDYGEFSCEIPLSEPNLSRSQFAPYRTDWYLYRGSGNLMEAGMITSTNLNGNRDTVLVSGKSWLHYLDRRIYPFDPVAYKDGDWRTWPKQWYTPPIVNGQGNPMEVKDIVEDLLTAMEESYILAAPPLPGIPQGRGALGLSYNNPPTGQETKLKIYPGDQTTILGHIKSLSEMVNGFEYDIIPGTREFKMWGPTGTQTPLRTGRDSGYSTYTFRLTEDEANGAVSAIDWTNDGPDGTVLLGLASGKTRVGQRWYYNPSVEQFRWLDKVYDFGSIQYPDRILQMLKDQNDLYPQEKLSLTILNPEFLTPNFYTGGRPRSLLGNRVTVSHVFTPYRDITADYKVNKIKWNVDQSTNEEVELELEIIYE